MTERERQMIAEYLPGEPDPKLRDGEYYYLQSTMGGERVIKVFPLDILPYHDGTEYGIYQEKGNRMVWIDSGWGDPSRGVRFHDLYDNKEDCKNRTHYFMDEWEKLRELQQEERDNVSVEGEPDQGGH